MKLALFGKQLRPEFESYFSDFLLNVRQNGADPCIYAPFREQLLQAGISSVEAFKAFSNAKELSACAPDYLFSFGGDGTLLDAVALIGQSDIPVLGINAGRLGFLSSIGIEHAPKVVEEVAKGAFSMDKRNLLSLSASHDAFQGNQYALNEFTIHKRDTSAMLTIHAYLNGDLLNTYWSDGLIVATPTGSTAYSLSCGGPVVMPETQSFVITPVASHNISIRPMIVPDHVRLSFEVEGRGKNFLISLDSRYEVVDYTYKLDVQRAGFCINLLKLHHQSFIATLREKLMLGIDNRNT